MKRLLMIYNPVAGDGRVANALSGILNYWTSQDYLISVRPTQGPQDARAYLKEHATEYERILAAGGDGMLHEAVNGLAQAGFPAELSYLPAGTTNDFANTHNISLDLMEACHQIRTGSTSYLDLGNFNGEYFAYVAACGVGTKVSYEVSQEEKKRFGPLAYVVRGLSMVDFLHWENNCIHMKVRWLEGETEGDFLFFSVSNSKYIGGSDKFVPFFSWNDGLLEGLMIRRPMNLPELNAILAGIMRQEYSERYFVQVRSPWFEIECDPANWTLDGEYGGLHEHVRIEAASRVLPITLPAKEKEEDPDEK